MRLRWNPAGRDDLTTARVMREGRFGAREIARVEGREYLDRDVGAGGRYRYTVVLLGDDGREALPSERIEIEVPAR